MKKLRKAISLLTVFLLCSCGNNSSIISSGTDSSPSSCENSNNVDSSISTGEDSESQNSSSSVEPGDPTSIKGIDDITIKTGHYFDAFEGVSATSSTGIDITDNISCSGYVDYGTVGSYVLTYTLDYNSKTETNQRTITVSDNGTYTAPVNNKAHSSNTQVNIGDGSYATGTTKAPNPANPNNIRADLLENPIPTNSWYSGLFTNPSNTGLYINQYRSSFIDGGVEISDVGVGGDQVYRTNKDMADNGSYTSKTISNFTPTFRDLKIKPAKSGNTKIEVQSYSENGLRVALKNQADNIDDLVVTYAQGSPYVFFETKGTAPTDIDLSIDGVTGGYRYFNLDGTQIDGLTPITSEGIIVSLVSRHRGYSYQDNGVSNGVSFGAPIYKDVFFLINAPENTVFTPKHNSHPDSSFLDRLTIAPTKGNYFSVTPLGESFSKEMVSFYHQHAYSMACRSNSSFTVDHKKSLVNTHYSVNVQHIDKTDATSVFGLLPHQWKKTASTPSPYSVEAMRGTIKMLADDSFDTSMSFAGVLPSFTTPTSSTFDKIKMVSYLNRLNDNLVSDGVYDDKVDSKDYLDNTAPYWNSKALYPLSQGLIIASQLNEERLKANFIEKIRLILDDWFTYSGENDSRYLYYNDTWGSMYYSDDAFSTGTRLSDHHFTHGYLVFASAVLSMFDSAFLTSYKGMVSLLLKDYESYDHEDDEMYPYLRTFDTYSGHSWSDGFGDAGDGNNQESCGEALNSWVAGYLFGLATGDTELVDTSIYGYTTELYSVKQYWFDYDETNWYDSGIPASANVHALGMVWGGKNEYQTWFGPSPEFIYGIHWLPTGEYLSSYALGNDEQKKLTKIYNTFLKERGGAPKTWFSNMWSIQSLCSSSTAIYNFDDNKILGDDYPNELSGAYWMVEAMDGLKNHSSASYAEITSNVAGSVYDNGFKEVVLLWNAGKNNKTVTIHYGGNKIKEVVAVSGFTSVDL